MARRRSRSRTTYRRKYVYVSDFSDSDSEDDCCRGRVGTSRGILSFFRPRSQSNHRMTINETEDDYFDWDESFETNMKFIKRGHSPVHSVSPPHSGFPWRPMGPCIGHAHQYHEWIPNSNSHALCGYGGKESDKDKKAKERKAPEEQMEQDRRAMEEILKRMRAADADNRFKARPSLKEPRNLTDIDLDIAKVNRELLQIGHLKERSRSSRGRSRVRFSPESSDVEEDEFEIYAYR